LLYRVPETEPRFTVSCAKMEKFSVVACFLNVFRNSL
jgi:hypothetical protein